MAKIIYVPDLSPEDALRIFRDPKSHVYIEIKSAGGTFELMFEMFNHRIVQVSAERTELIEVARTVLDMAIVTAAFEDPRINDEQHDTWVLSIIAEVTTTGRYGNRPGGEQGSGEFVITA